MYNFFETLHPSFELIAIPRATNILEMLLGDWQQNLLWQCVTNSTQFTVNCSIMVSQKDNYMKKSLFGTKIPDILSPMCNSAHANTLLDSRSV